LNATDAYERDLIHREFDQSDDSKFRLRRFVFVGGQLVQMAYFQEPVTDHNLLYRRASSCGACEQRRFFATRRFVACRLEIGDTGRFLKSALLPARFRLKARKFISGSSLPALSSRRGEGGTSVRAGSLQRLRAHIFSLSFLGHHRRSCGAAV